MTFLVVLELVNLGGEQRLCFCTVNKDYSIAPIVQMDRTSDSGSEGFG